MEGKPEIGEPGDFTRRMFVGAGVALGVLAVAPPVWAASTTEVAAINRSRFAALVGQPMRLSGNGVQLGVTLTEVSELQPMRFAGDPERFALLLQAPAGAPRVSGIYTLSQRTLGRVDLFVSAVDQGVKASQFQAVIDTSQPAGN